MSDAEVNREESGRPVAATNEPKIRRRFQFGIGTMLSITTVTAIVCALLFRIPVVFAIPIMLFIGTAVLPALWTTVVVFGRGYQRAFGIGALFPSAAFLLLFVVYVIAGPMPRFGSANEDDFFIRLLICAFWLSSVLVGLLCIGVRRLVEGRPDSRG
jgi:hypothetical protein